MRIQPDDKEVQHFYGNEMEVINYLSLINEIYLPRSEQIWREKESPGLRAIRIDAFFLFFSFSNEPQNVHTYTGHTYKQTQTHTHTPIIRIMRSRVN